MRSLEADLLEENASVIKILSLGLLTEFCNNLNNALHKLSLGEFWRTFQFQKLCCFLKKEHFVTKFRRNTLLEKVHSEPHPEWWKVKEYLFFACFLGAFFSLWREALLRKILPFVRLQEYSPLCRQAMYFWPFHAEYPPRLVRPLFWASRTHTVPCEIPDFFYRTKIMSEIHNIQCHVKSTTFFCRTKIMGRTELLIVLANRKIETLKTLQKRSICYPFVEWETVLCIFVL